MLGIDFFVGTAAEAIAHISKYDGLLVAPAAPSFIALQDDPDYRRAIADANLAIADSGWAVLFWRLLRRERLTRISGLALFKALLEIADTRIPGNLFFILPSEKAKSKTLEFGWVSGYPITDADCYVAPRYFSCSHGSVSRGGRERVSQKRGYSIADDALVAILQSRKPKHIIIGIGGGMQDKLGSYLKHQLIYRPGNLLHRSCGRLRHRRSNRHSGVGGSIFCRLDIPDHRPTARLPNSLLESSFPAASDYQVWNQDSAIANELIKRQLFDGLP